MLQALRVYCDVAGLRSFSQAAKRHDITQSAVSQRIRQLEQRLGTRLLDRSTRPFELTAAGRLLYEEGLGLLAQADQLTERITALGKSGEETVTGVVTASAIYSAGIGLLRQLQEDFGKAHPGIRVEMQYERPEAVAENVLSGRSDLGIISYPKRWRGVKAIGLREEPMHLVCALEHPLAAQKRVAVADLEGVSMVGFENSLPVSRAVSGYLRKNGVQATVAQSVDNIDTIKNMVQATGDVAILPRRTVLHETVAGTLRSIPLQPVLNRPLGIIHTKKRSLTSAARVFMDYLLHHAGPEVELRIERASQLAPSISRS